jgi:cytochrome c5
MRLQYGMKLAVAILTFALSGNCFAAEAGEAVYRDKCAMCHDAGTDKAPRIGAPEDWKARFAKGREGLLRSAIKGVPGTAMAAKGGFFQLPDAEVAEAVDYMLARAGFNPDDAAMARDVREALERAHIFGVRVECTDGAVVLTGVTEDADAVRTAVAAARAVPGVREVEHRVSPAAVFQ